VSLEGKMGWKSSIQKEDMGHATLEPPSEEPATMIQV
jgi:hypothetical protein